MVNTFAGFYLDRRAELRDDPDWADQARADGETLFVLAAGLAQLVSHEPQPEIAFVRADHPLVADAPDSSLTLLGWFRGARCVLVDIGHASDERLRLELPAAARLEELRPLASILPKDSAGLLAYARALMFWRERHRFCGVCGRATMPGRAGHVLNCRAADSGCGASFFPRLDPAVIVLVTDNQGERALLGRQASWPPGRYSTVAGFVEPGESLEDAVAREVHEETGVRVKDVRYLSSQPWPFPSSLMLGFQAVGGDEPIEHIDGELEDARWFTRAQIAAGEPMLPPPTSISYRLIETWFDTNAATPLRQQPYVGRWDTKREGPK
ncbi:MAG: NAD(+) diphosphatase [Proteobacteria bacterium]|nr:NAD(+) diphosphatase [Pseudomonadota bacterium]